MRRFAVDLVCIAIVCVAFYMVFLIGGGYALKQRAKEHGYDCVLHVNLANENEVGAAVIRNLKEGKCASVRVVGYTITAGERFMQFHDYAQIRYPDGNYCVYEPLTKIPTSESRPVECIRISAKHKDGVIPATCFNK